MKNYETFSSNSYDCFNVNKYCKVRRLENKCRNNDRNSDVIQILHARFIDRADCTVAFILLLLLRHGVLVAVAVLYRRNAYYYCKLCLNTFQSKLSSNTVLSYITPLDRSKCLSIPKLTERRNMNYMIERWERYTNLNSYRRNVNRVKELYFV